MEEEGDGWSGIFVSLPGVDKAAHMWGGVNDPEDTTPGYDPMTHMEYATETADAQVGRIIRALEDSGEMDDTLVVLTADHGSVAAADGHFHGDFEPENDYGFYNWYYGAPANDEAYERPQDALLPLIDGTDDSTGRPTSALLQRLLAERLAEGPDARRGRRGGGHHGGPARRDRGLAARRRPLRPGLAGPLGPDEGAEKLWFARKAQELVDTQARRPRPDLIATLPDDTTYSVLGDHGGIQRASQQIPIVFAGGNTSHQDLRAEVRSVDIMPTILRAMGIAPTVPMDGIAYELPTKGTALRSVADAAQARSQACLFSGT